MDMGKQSKRALAANAPFGKRPWKRFVTARGLLEGLSDAAETQPTARSGNAPTPTRGIGVPHAFPKNEPAPFGDGEQGELE